MCLSATENWLARDHICARNQLVAEYRGGTDYYYYASDQVNSTRAVTNGSGTVVYSVAYDPYGGIQKTWGTPTYTPSLKFSGKERDAESGLDYFGARYHASFYYRFLSADPIINRQDALGNPQLWNLYSFCRDSPIAYWDPNGMDFITIQQGKDIVNKAEGWKGTPYKLGGIEKGKEGKGADCIGSSWGVLKEAGFDYERQSTKTFVKSLEKGQVNEGRFRQIEDQNSPQAGDIGLTDNHMMIYSGKKGEKNEYFVWSARREGRTYGEHPLKWFTSDVNQKAVWYRYYLPDK